MRCSGSRAYVHLPSDVNLMPGRRYVFLKTPPYDNLWQGGMTISQDWGRRVEREAQKAERWQARQRERQERGLPPEPEQARDRQRQSRGLGLGG